jgi:hypothetical protein
MSDDLSFLSASSDSFALGRSSRCYFWFWDAAWITLRTKVNFSFPKINYVTVRLLAKPVPLGLSCDRVEVCACTVVVAQKVTEIV